MIISVNWLKQFTEIDGSIDELVQLIGSRLVEVEAVIDIGARYQGVLIADVKKVAPHPNADKLKVVHIDDGGNNQSVKRLENGLIELVCGAPNVVEGLKVAWVPPGAILPATASDPKPVVLEARELRGVVSSGMLASAKELHIGDEHAGIVAIDKDVAAGTSFAAAYELDDYLLDIENKSLTHRPDCFGLIGFAREVAAIQGKQFSTPTWLTLTDPFYEPIADDVEPLTITASIAQADISKRYQLLAFEGVNAKKQSPFAIKTWLARVGIRPISAVVDITNYLMYLTGQPLHAFDLDAVLAEHPDGKAEIIVRESAEGEKLALLDGRTITLGNQDIIICAGDKPIALAGAMGGATTEVTENTTRVLLECATFDLYRLRTTQMRHGIFSEAITRFTKGQSPEQTAPVLASAARMLEAVTRARRISEVIDEYPGKEMVEPIHISQSYLNATLGTAFSVEAIDETLRHVEITTEHDATTFALTPPYWRADLHIAEDIIEEVGRINGFDEIMPKLPLRPSKGVSPSSDDLLKAHIRRTLVRAGANELLTYSFVPEKLLMKAGQDGRQAFKIVNALSPELQYYRLSLTPSLLDKVHMNIKAGFERFALFELNKVHGKQYIEGSENLPQEFSMLSLVYANQKPLSNAGSAYYSARRFLDYLTKSLGVTLDYAKADAADFTFTSPYNLQRSAIVSVRETGGAIGIVGEMLPAVAQQFKLPEHVAGFEIDVEKLALAWRKAPYVPLSRYPGTTRDITLQLPDSRAFAEVEAVVRDVLHQVPLETVLQPVNVYKSEKDASGQKHVTLRLYLTNHERTITADEANAVVDQVAAAASAQLDAQVV
ncbi:MAG TPA: phenylalanine--tRNA ligase subunit beta [Candidatus Saccharimonadales bacterium]